MSRLGDAVSDRALLGVPALALAAGAPAVLVRGARDARREGRGR
ncbi:hypothetical protein [Streptomyces sp. NPDC017890]